MLDHLSLGFSLKGNLIKVLLLQTDGRETLVLETSGITAHPGFWFPSVPRVWAGTGLRDTASILCCVV